MPNTLAHIGVHGLASRALDRKADLKWILAGCVIPDVPWILARIAGTSPTLIDPYDLTLYAFVQSSLGCCLLLCGAAALLSSAPRRIFILLAFNSALHLLLDACQTKLGNGVLLFAPFSWKLLNFGLFWPESPITWLLTAAGVAFLVVAWPRRRGLAVDFSFLTASTAEGWALTGRGRLAIAAGLTAVWMIMPALLMAGADAADVYSIKTMRDRENRAGRVVAFDRTPYSVRDGQHVVEVYDEELVLVGSLPDRPGRLSWRGRFVDEKTVEVLESHFHTFPRDLPSYVGLALIALIWLEGSRKRQRRSKKKG